MYHIGSFHNRSSSVEIPATETGKKRKGPPGTAFPDRHYRYNGIPSVVCGLVIDHIPNLDGLFREMHRVCRPAGFVVVSVMHPAMMLRGVQARFKDPTSGREIRPASCSHQLSDYVMAAARAGFSFDHLSEQGVDEALANHLERARRYLGWPMLFLMRLAPGARGSVGNRSVS